jgi:hypothetical protein
VKFAFFGIFEQQRTLGLFPKLLILLKELCKAEREVWGVRRVRDGGRIDDG